MLARIQKAVREKDAGFTLIELLVVMIIIGILAAIAIPTFLNQRQNGYNSTATSDLRNAATAVESWAVDRGGNYSTLTTATLMGAPAPAGGGAATPGLIDSSPDVTITVATGSTATEFCLDANHSSVGAANSIDFHFRKSEGAPATGAC